MNNSYHKHEYPSNSVVRFADTQKQKFIKSVEKHSKSLLSKKFTSNGVLKGILKNNNLYDSGNHFYNQKFDHYNSEIKNIELEKHSFSSYIELNKENIEPEKNEKYAQIKLRESVKNNTESF